MPLQEKGRAMLLAPFILKRGRAVCHGLGLLQMIIDSELVFCTSLK